MLTILYILFPYQRGAPHKYETQRLNTTSPIHITVAKEAQYVGSVEKIPLERLSRAKMNISFRCPVCKAATIKLNTENMDRWKDVRCPVCHSTIVFEGFSISVIRPRIPAKTEKARNQVAEES